MNAQPVLLDVRGGVAHVTLNRPERRNAVDGATVAAFHDLLDEVEQSPAELVVLRGAGRTFCAGGDLGYLAELGEAGAAAATGPARQLLRVLDRLGRLPQVVLSVVEGTAVGYGLCLVLRADIVVAADTARFGAPELGAGIRPTGVMAELLRCLPSKVAWDWLVQPHLRTAAEAAAAGIISRFIPEADFDEVLDSQVRALERMPVGLLRSTKALWRELVELAPDDRLDHAAAAVAETLTWPSTQHALTQLLAAAAGRRHPDHD